MIKVGLELFLENEIREFKGKKIGLVTNFTGVNHNLEPTIDLFFHNPDIELAALYAPEHGIRGEAKEGEEIFTFTDPYTNLPVYSLYCQSKKPSHEMLKDVDVIVFDLQDIGARYYTFTSTMALVMEACGEAGKSCVILDRPNPIGSKMEGNLVNEEFRSFVGWLPIPNRHGLTLGELALVFKYVFHINCDLKVVKMEGWKRSLFFDQTDLFWVPPSPNTTKMDMMILYPGTCLIEGTNLSEGRGTAHPFEFIGAPFIDGRSLAKHFNECGLTGVIARPISFIPTYNKHTNKRCEGIQLHIKNRAEIESVKTGVTLISLISRMYPNEFSFKEPAGETKKPFDLLAGTNQLRSKILDGKISEFFEECDEHLSSFRKQVVSYLLYK